MATGQVVLYPGSFDPFHLGHLDVAAQAVSIFGSVVIAVMHNPEKPAGMFSVDERVQLAKDSTAHLAVFGSRPMWVWQLMRREKCRPPAS